MSDSKTEQHWGDQRRMRAKAKVTIRRRDRRKLSRLDPDQTVAIEPIIKRSKLTNIK